jgi:hypothetical protein
MPFTPGNLQLIILIGLLLPDHVVIHYLWYLIACLSILKTLLVFSGI